MILTVIIGSLWVCTINIIVYLHFYNDQKQKKTDHTQYHSKPIYTIFNQYHSKPTINIIANPDRNLPEF
jgi:hypothetical protein